MNLRLERRWFIPRATIGELRIDDTFECFTLEDVVREGDIFVVRVPGAPAIPEGRYGVRMSFSPRFQQELPEVMNVPNFTGIRIHPGNTATDAEGCVLVGNGRGADQILERRLAFVPLLAKIREGLHAGPVNLTVLNVRA